MKLCSICRIYKSEDQFNKKGKNRLHSYCRDCQKIKWKIYYSIPEKKRAHNLNRSKHDSIKRLNYKNLINKIKDVPCLDCKMKYNPWQMDFDHVGDNKVDDIAIMIRNKVPLQRILDEIKKCELVCANCHRDRTYKRMIGSRLIGKPAGSDPVSSSRFES